MPLEGMRAALTLAHEDGETPIRFVVQRPLAVRGTPPGELDGVPIHYEPPAKHTRTVTFFLEVKK